MKRRNKNKNRKNEVKFTLILVLTFLGFNTALIVILAAAWMIGNLPVDQAMAILRNPSNLVSNWQLWMASGYGALGFRYLVSLLFHDPMIMATVFASFILAGIGLVLVFQFSRHLDLETKKLCYKLENSSLRTERQVRKIKLAADQSRGGKKAKTKEPNLQNKDKLSRTPNRLQPVTPIDSHPDEFPLLGIDASFHKKEANDLKLAGRLMEEGKAARQQYENILHQASSKLSALYFLLEDLSEQNPIADNPEILANLTDCETVLDECTALLKSELHHSVYTQFRLDHELLLCVHEKQANIKRKHLKVRLHLEPISISGNSLWLKQVFETLLANAIDFSKPEGTLQITSRLNDHQIQIQFENTLDGSVLSSLTSDQQALPDPTRRYQTKRAGHFGIGHDLVDKVLKSHQGHLETKVENEIFRAILLLPFSELDQYSR